MSFTKVAPAGIGTSPGSTIRLGDSLLHSTGLDIGVGSGIGVTIRQHGDATFTGIITASAFFGDGSGLEGVSSSGIGTPLSDDDTSDLNKAYYVNQELSIGSTVTVNHPDSAVASYTHYQDVVVKDDADFIVADGDTFIPDILGINTSGLPSPRTGATGGRIRAGTITNAGANGAPNFPNGITVTGIVTASTLNSTTNQIVVGSAVTANSTGIDVTGVVTATSFKGAATNLTSIPAANITGTLPAISGANLTNLNGSNISSGIVTSARLGGGTASSSTFLRGDGTFQVVNTDLVSDTSPQLGGNLDTNSHEISLDTSHAINFGDSNELRVFYHSGNGQIDFNGTTSLQLKTPANKYFQVVNRDTGDNIIQAQAGGVLQLYHNGAKKFDTTTTGIRVHGDEGGTAQLQLLADEGDDNPDYWRFIAETNGILNIQDYGSGNWYNNIRLNAAAGGVELYFDNSKKMETVTGGVYVYGDIVGAVGGTGNIYVGDNNKFIAGSGNDLQIFHDGSNSKITNATGHIVITTNSLDINNAADNETLAKFDHDGAVELYHNNVKQLETNITGITLPKGGIYGMGGSMALIGGTIVPNQDKTWKFPFNTNHAGTNHGYEFTIEIVLNHWNTGDYYKILERYLFGRGNTTSYQTVTKIDDRGTGSANWNTSHFDQVINLSGGSGSFPATLEITYDAESAPGYTSGYHIFVRHSGGMGVPIIT